MASRASAPSTQPPPPSAAQVEERWDRLATPTSCFSLTSLRPSSVTNSGLTEPLLEQISPPPI